MWLAELALLPQNIWQLVNPAMAIKNYNLDSSVVQQPTAQKTYVTLSNITKLNLALWFLNIREENKARMLACLAS